MAQQAEGPFNALLSCFDSPLYVQSHKHANVIGRYVANMFCRSHQRRLASHRQQERVVAVATEIVDDPKQLRQLAAAFSFRLRSPFPIDCVREAVLGIAASDSAESRNAQYLDNFQAYEDDISGMLSGRAYGLLRAPEGKEFILGDTAVITRRPIGPVMEVGVGFNKEGMHVLLPVSPKTCIQIGIPSLADQRLQADEVDSINADQIKLMHRFVYGRSKDTRIQMSVDSIGGSLNYLLHAFVTPELTKERALDFFVREILAGSSTPRP